ncbi:hypothetical protein KSP40_PGU022176 [Platanthera guangdongensis]|uniref:Uncharacterized protein n=1 Tax=Platanthera guangdongensis TaxID=2320717 RepID=A0ABR2LDA3_9ASPA
MSIMNSFINDIFKKLAFFSCGRHDHCCHAKHTFYDILKLNKFIFSVEKIKHL